MLQKKNNKINLVFRARLSIQKLVKCVRPKRIIGVTAIHQNQFTVYFYFLHLAGWD